jgi:PHD/YefM family antitoxin component YafN of YafNO toxin-antitoxin module
MSLTITPISQVRQHLPQLAKEMQITNQEIIVVSKSKPLMVLVPYLKWQEDQKNNEEKAWQKKSNQSFVYDVDEKDNFNPKKLKPIK